MPFWLHCRQTLCTSWLNVPGSCVLRTRETGRDGLGCQWRGSRGTHRDSPSGLPGCCEQLLWARVLAKASVLWRRNLKVGAKPLAVSGRGQRIGVAQMGDPGVASQTSRPLPKSPSNRAKHRWGRGRMSRVKPSAKSTVSTTLCRPPVNSKRLGEPHRLRNRAVGHFPRPRLRPARSSLPASA